MYELGNTLKTETNNMLQNIYLVTKSIFTCSKHIRF